MNRFVVKPQRRAGVGGFALTTLVMALVQMPRPVQAQSATQNQTAHVAGKPLSWQQRALQIEADYLADCSFTLDATNRGQVRRGVLAYGALNNVRLAGGPDWVRPGEGAMAIIGLMAASRQLHAGGVNVERYNRVIDSFFQDWLLEGRSALCQDSTSIHFGGVASEVKYTAQGELRAPVMSFNSGATGAMLCAMVKYMEYNRHTHRKAAALKWEKSPAFATALRAGQFLARCYHAKYNLMSPSPSGGNLWINDASLARAGLVGLEAWARQSGRPALLAPQWSAGQLAARLQLGLEGMKDKGPRAGFFKYLNPADGSRSYGDSIDQLCFVPYEANALDPAQPFARQISDFWTHGADGIRMTYQTSDPASWTFFGTRWHHYFTPNKETDRLTPGAGLQLAKVEWKYATARHDATLRQRALERYRFVTRATRSNLWMGSDGRQEAGVGGGIVDWRLAEGATSFNGGPAVPGGAQASSAVTGQVAPEWQRFIDTSAYFIQVTLMLFWDRDTIYVPEPGF